jgi:glucose/arabinose dehydrogenase
MNPANGSVPDYRDSRRDLACATGRRMLDLAARQSDACAPGVLNPEKVSQGMRLWGLALTVGAALCFPVAASAAVSLEKLGDFNQPVEVAQPPGVKGLLFVAENPGSIAVLSGGSELDHKFLDISDRVDCGCGERGLKSIAFDPGYKRNRRFYVLYTNTDGNTEVDSFERSPDSTTRADPNSGRQVIVIPLGPNPDFCHCHQGDQLQFGPGGHLYVSVGDGGCCYDPGDQARNLDDLHGKILRIDPAPAGGYTIPKDNPLVGKPGRDEIFAWGFRNPWRFSFDGDRIAIGDVGEHAQEEIDYETVAQAKGANFGWPEYEGTLLDDPLRPGPGPPVAPIFTYPHGPGCAVTGGYVVGDRTLGALYGRYVYSDWCTGELRSFRPPTVGAATDDQPLGLIVPYPSSFGRGSDGRIYVASYLGPVYRLAPAS